MLTPERLKIRKMMANFRTRVKREMTAVGQFYTEQLARANLSIAGITLAPTAKEATKWK